MRIKLLTDIVGPHGVWRPGEVHDVPVNFGAALLNGGYAEHAEAIEAPPVVSVDLSPEPMAADVAVAPKRRARK